MYGIGSALKRISGNNYFQSQDTEGGAYSDHSCRAPRAVLSQRFFGFLGGWGAGVVVVKQEKTENSFTRKN